jgi:hypothetical protein
MNGAFDRRQAQDADIVLGQLELWIGVGANVSWPWLDVAVRIGKGWGTFLDLHGPMVQRGDFAAFVPALRDFAEGRRDDALLASLGGSMRVTLRRSEHGSLHGEAWFSHGPNSQTVSFSLWDGSLRTAVPQAEAALERVKRDQASAWMPAPDLIQRLPRATGLEPPQGPTRFEAWESGLTPARELRFDYTVDGYGWFSLDVRADDQRGEAGGGYLTDAMGDMLRAALAMLAGARSARVTFNAEPGLQRLELEVVALSMDVTDAGMPARHRRGCWIRLRDIDHNTGADGEVEFEALAGSPRAVAEAIYDMGARHFADGAGPWTAPMAALQGALATVPLVD